MASQLQHFLQHYGYLAVFLFGFLEACCVPIPSEVTFGFAGVLAGEGHLHGLLGLPAVVVIIVVGTVAELLGSMVSYSVGRKGGRPLVRRFGRYLLITQGDVDRAERFLAGRGAWAVCLARALPLVRTFSSIVAGMVEVPAALFALLSLIGTAVWVTVISLIGFGLGKAWSRVSNDIQSASYVIAVLVVLAIAAFIVYRLRELRHEGGGPPGGAGGGPGAPGRADQPSSSSPIP